MARERMVTRTVCNGIFDVMTVNPGTKEVANYEISVPSYNSLNDKQVLNIINNELSSPLVHVMHNLVRTEEVLYGMPEVEFMKYARVLPPRTKADNE